MKCARLAKCQEHMRLVHIVSHAVPGGGGRGGGGGGDGGGEGRGPRVVWGWVVRRRG